MDIVLYPNPALREAARPVGAVTPDVADTARQMATYMREHGGIGLAGPQVGILRRLVVINLTGEPKDDAVFIDPRITARRGTEEGEEGCLSFPGIRVMIRRAAWVRIEAASLEGEPIQVEAEGLLARVLQHEIDHLDGLLLVDRMSPAERRANLPQLRDLESRFERAAAS